MITLEREGDYRLIETKNNTKVLTLDQETYAWVEPANIGEILITSHATHNTDCILSVGKYRLLSVVDEPQLTDTLHLELEAGPGTRQGYLLITGLPDDEHKRARIIPTHELAPLPPRAR